MTLHPAMSHRIRTPAAAAIMHADSVHTVLSVMLQPSKNEETIKSCLHNASGMRSEGRSKKHERKADPTTKVGS